MTVLVTTRMLGQVARMKTPRLFGFNEQCIEFYYWISGRYVGTLNVYTEVSVRVDSDVYFEIIVIVI